MKLSPAFALPVVLVACSTPKPPAMADASSGPPAVPTALAAAGDFTPGDPGVLATVDTQTKAVTKGVAPAGAIGDTPQLRLFGSSLYVINQGDGDNITILDASSFSLIDQLATGASSNPQDVAVTAGNLYVPILGGSGVAVLTPGSTTITVIDLSAGAPDPGFPYCVANTLVGSQLFVACELLNASFAATVPGEIYVIDTTDNSIVTSFALMNENPVGTFHALPNGDLAIATANFTTSAGCIEQITTTGTPASAGCIVTNAALNGVVSRFEIEQPINPSDDTLMWLSVATLGPNDSFAAQTLYSYDLTTSTLSAAISPPAEQIGDVAVCYDGTIAVSDAATNASGVRLYKNNVEETTAPLAIGLDTDSTYALVCD